MKRIHALCIALLLVWPQVSFAEERDANDPWQGHLSLESVHQTMGPIVADDTGIQAESDRWLSTRIMLSTQYRPTRNITLLAEGELRVYRAFDQGMEFGLDYGHDTFEFGRHQDARAAYWIPRQLSVEWVTSIGLFRCGHQSAHCGTGLLVHDGKATRIFGDGWTGNRVERCVYGAKVGDNLTFFAGGDYVFRDDNAEHLEGDRAFGWTLGLRYLITQTPSKAKQSVVSLLFAQRFQEDRLDPRQPDGKRTQLDVNSIDFYLKWVFPLTSGASFLLESEMALLFGETTRPYLEETFEDGAEVLAAGGVMRLGYQGSGINATLEAGFASGDNDPQDATIRQFTFNRSYTVGLILFEHVLPVVTARSVDRVTDPGLLDVPPSGLRYTVNQGAVRNALFLYPTLSWRPDDRWSLRFAYLFAQRASDALDVYQSAINGGYNTSLGGEQPGGRILGQEVDLGVDFEHRLGSLAYRLSVDGGVFLAGDAFSGLINDPVYTTRVSVGIQW
ncbi:MAG: hypothetical protein VYA30_02845 [Myxococcota bacterium]|nr:hypothetical protein [Myxococcota bacterium]